MQKILLLLACVVIPTIILAQRPVSRWMISGDIIPINSKTEAGGWGISAGWERFFNEKWSLSATAAYAYMRGRVIDPFALDPKYDTLNNIAMLPVLAAAHYYIRSNFFVGVGAGPSFGLLHRTGTKLAVAPEAGVTIPVGPSKFGIGAQWVLIPVFQSSPQNPFFYNGGFSFVSIHLAYQWPVHNE